MHAPAAASSWDSSEALHVRRAVLEAAVRNGPSPHRYVENVFSPAAYSALLRFFPVDSAMREWSTGFALEHYKRRREINLPREAPRLPADQRAFWDAAAAFFLGPHFRQTLFEGFAPSLHARFGEQIDDPAFVRDRIRGVLVVNEHEPGYYLGPHTDRRERILTCLFYFPDRDGLEHLGTTLYRALEPGFTCPGDVDGATVHHDPSGFQPCETIPYRPNSVLIFPKSDVLFHGVQLLSAEELQGSRRRGMQVQFLLNQDVFPAWVAPAGGFHPLERAGGESFRWAGDEATVDLQPSRGDVLEFDAESGPGMGSQPFRLHVTRPDGVELAVVDVGARARARIPLSACAGSASLLLRAEAEVLF